MMQISLFTSNSKEKRNDRNKLIKVAIFIKRAVLIFVTVFCFLKLVDVFNYLYKNVESEQETRFWMHHFYENENNIDNLFLGSSHVFSDVIPDILNKNSSEYNYNLSTSGQKFSESYILLQEANELHNIKHVYLEMYYEMHVDENYYCLERHFVLLDFLRNSLKKFKLIYELNPKEEMLATFIPFVRYKQNIFDNKYIKEQINVKNGKNYKEYKYEKKDDNGYTLYHENGYREKDYVLPTIYLHQKRGNMEKNPLSQEALKYLQRIIDYCKTNNIELTLFSSPIYELQLYSVGNYDAYVNQVKQIAEENGLKYYDFNLCKEEYLPIQNVKYFADIGHLNSDGAKLFTTVLDEVISNDRSDYFYNTYKEKLDSTKCSVYGIVLEGENEKGEQLYTIASKSVKELEYYVEFIPNDCLLDTEVIQGYSVNNKIILTNDLEGNFFISVRYVGEERPFTELQIKRLY